MATDNLVSVNIPVEDQDAIKTAFTTLDEKLLPNLIDLTAADRKGLLKMGDKSISFVEKALEYAETNPNLLPGYVDIAGMKIDLNAVKVLTEYLRIAVKLADMLDDTIFLSGNEAFKTGLKIYKAIQQAAKSGIPGAEVIYEDLRQRFEKTREKTGENTATI